MFRVSLTPGYRAAPKHTKMDVRCIGIRTDYIPGPKRLAARLYILLIAA